jgi:alpha-tubulin suppressor-like RCC1 family protein
MLLDCEGNIWAFGLNLNGQLGVGHQKTVEKPIKIKGFKNRLAIAKSEGDINFAIDEKGEAYMWPWNDKLGKIRLDPIALPFNKEKVNLIACGNNFVLFLSKQGSVYSMGKSNKYGQLGHGDNNHRYKPTLIEFFQINNERITQISCGFKHCAARSSTGKTYTWGLGCNGQLGHNDYNNYTLPHKVNIHTLFTKVLQVSCGFRSTYFLVVGRKVYFCGCSTSYSMQNYPLIFNILEKVFIF